MTKQTSAVQQFADELRKWWSFDDRQCHTHNWHSREDFIADRLPALLAGSAHEITKETILMLEERLEAQIAANRGYSEKWMEWKAKADGLQNPWLAADDKDWDRLLQMIPDSGHGQFWKMILLGHRAAITPQTR